MRIDSFVTRNPDDCQGLLHAWSAMFTAANEARKMRDQGVRSYIARAQLEIRLVAIGRNAADRTRPCEP